MKRHGFTLVELLMVILIIGLLAALLSNAIWSAMTSARETAISVELGQLATSLNQYKEARGEYPPDMNPVALRSTNYRTHVMRHVRRAWPRNVLPPPIQQPDFDRWARDVRNTTGQNPRNMSQAGALVFWLGGAYRNSRLDGFSASATRPFGPGSQRTKGYFAFDETRLVLRNGWPVYTQPRTNTPYVYFAPVNGHYEAFGPNRFSAGRGGTAQPYSLSKAGPNGQVNPLPVYVEAKTFQIVAPGLDETFGAPRQRKWFPHGLGYTGGDEDNLTSFSQGPLEDRKP